MKKVNALVLGIVFLFASFIPFTSAFAANDPGMLNWVINNYFTWYTNFPGGDTNGYLYNTAFPSGDNYVNGVHDTSYSMGTYASAPSAGDYIMYTMISDVLSNYTTPTWMVDFLVPETQSFETDAFDFSVLIDDYEIPSYYQFTQLHISVDNRYYNRVRFLFSVSSPGILSIKLTANKSNNSYFTPVLIRFNGARNNVSTGFTEAEMVQVQASITTALNVARLADLVEIDSSDVDLSTLETTTASILQKLANVPDIIQYIDQLETLDSNIISAINIFYNYFYSQFNFDFSAVRNITFYDNNFNIINTSSYVNVNESFYMLFDIGTNYYNCLKLTLYTPVSPDTIVSFSYKYLLSNTNINNSYMNDMFTEQYFYTYNNYNFNTYNSYFVNNTSYNLILIKITAVNYRFFFYVDNLSFIQIASKPFNQSWFDRIELYFKHLIGLNQSVPSSIQQTTDIMSEQVNDIVDFEDNYNQSLESSASQIDVSSYEIQQTQGMSFMRTYTELNFDRMQNFRILFLTPLILTLAAFFLRRKT